MAKQSDDYLDRFSDKDHYGPGSFSEAATSIFHPAAGIAAQQIRRMQHEQEMAGLVDKNHFKNQREAILRDNAVALCAGLYWVGMKRSKQLSANAIYVSERALKQINERIAPSCDKVREEVSTDALVSERTGNVFRVPNAVTLDAALKSKLTPAAPAALQPESAHKTITGYTDLNVAKCFKGTPVLVCFDDVLDFLGRNNALTVNFGKGAVTYPDSVLRTLKQRAATPTAAEAAAAAQEAKRNRDPGADEWRCPGCGKINKNYVGTCGCGTRKP